MIYKNDNFHWKIIFESHPKERTIRKVLGEVGNFPGEWFFSLTFPLYEFYLGQLMKFRKKNLGLLCVHKFASFDFSLHRSIFFVLRVSSPKMEVEQTIFVTHLIITVQLYYWLSKNPYVKIWSNKFQMVMINYSKLCASL